MTDISPAPAPAPAALAPTPPSYWHIPQPGWPVRIAFIAIAITAILLILAAWRLPPFGMGSERTEDAYVEGHTTVIAPQVAGYVRRVDVDDFETVRAGQVLAEIDPRPFEQRAEQASANLDAKLATLSNNRQQLAQGLAQVRVQDAGIASAAAKEVEATRYDRRSADLVRQGALSQRERENDEATLAAAAAALSQARATRDAAQQAVKAVKVNQGALAADVEAARAQLHQAEIDLGYTVLHAPQDGTLSQVGVRIGQFAAAGTPFLYLVPPQRWVIANFKEAQIRRMAVGQPAWFAVDALGGKRIAGHVERIAPASAAEFSALKPDNATGNFTKVPQRIPVRISVDPGQPLAARLRPGMSVEAHVDTASGGR